MVKRKICVAVISTIIGIELLTIGILLFVFSDTLIQSNVKQVWNTFFVSFI